MRQDVPYQVIGGPRFYERAEIRDATAYLTVLVNPSDAGSLLRIANRPRRGIGDTSLARVVSHADTTGRTLWEALADPEAAGVTSAACRAIRGFRSTMESLMAQSQELPVDELLERMLEKTGILDAYEAERTIEARGRIENLQELVGVAREYRQQTADASLAGFLQDISLVSDQDTIADDRGLVTLMTLHNAKGLEFNSVYAIGMEEGIFPHIRAIEEQGVEEERRLCYVGMTRAMERLTMTHTLSRSLWGRRSYNLAVALSRRAAARGGARAAEAFLVGELRIAGERGAAGRQPRAGSLDGRLGTPRLARRGRRHRARAGRGRDHPLRGGRHRAAADGRVRAAGEDRVSLEYRSPTGRRVRVGSAHDAHGFRRGAQGRGPRASPQDDAARPAARRLGR